VFRLTSEFFSNSVVSACLFSALVNSQVSSSEEEAEKLLAVAGDLGFRVELSRRLFGLLLAGSDSMSEEDPSVFVGARTSSIPAQCSPVRGPFGATALLERP